MANIGNLKPFQKGHDPRRNLKGRIPTTETKLFKQLLLKHGNKKVKVGDKMMTKMELIAHRIIDDAVRGKISALKLFLDRTEGKAQTAAQIQRNSGGKPNVTLSEKELQRLEKIFSDSK